MDTKPTISLLVPCLVENFLPEAAEAAASVLSRLGVRVKVPRGQTCCGQPLYKSGCEDEARALAQRALDVFAGSQPVVAPSGSCVRMLRDYPLLFAGRSRLRQRAEDLASRTFELTEYIVRVLGVQDTQSCFKSKAVYHDSCQVGRGLGLTDEPRALLCKVQGLTLLEPSRPEMCCGFGGIFSLQYPELAGALVAEKVEDLLATGADTVISAEVSCLMNIRHYVAKHDLPLKTMHIAQVLDSRESAT